MQSFPAEDLNQFFELSEDLMGIADLDGNIVRTNKKFQELLGYTEQELTGKSFVSFIHPDDIATSNLQIQKLLTGAKTVGFTNRYKKKDGSYVWLQWDSTASKNNLFGIAREITKELEQKNREIHYQLILEYANDAIISKNLSGVVTYWNTSAEKLYGYTRDEMLGASIQKIIPDEKQPEFKMIMDKVKNGQTMDHYETVRRAKDGRIVHVLLSIAPIKDYTGHIVGASVIAQDITIKKQEEKKLLDSYEEIKKMNELMTGRELKMIELKKHIDDLEIELNKISPKN